MDCVPVFAYPQRHIRHLVNGRDEQTDCHVSEQRLAFKSCCKAQRPVSSLQRCRVSYLAWVLHSVFSQLLLRALWCA